MPNTNSPVTGVPTHTPEDAVRLVRRLYGLDVRATQLVSYIDRNFCLEETAGRRWVLKVANAAEERTVIDFQLRAMELAAAKGLPVPRPRPTITGERVGSDGGHLVWLLSWVPGSMLTDEPTCPLELLGDLGAVLGRLDNTLADFEHPAVERELAWDLRNALRMRSLAVDVEDTARRAMVEGIFEGFGERVLRRSDKLPMSVIHNDANDWNVLVGERDGQRRVTGLIDFGDLIHSWTVGELAIAMAYAMFDKADPLVAGAAMVRGYSTERPLVDAEIDVLFDLVLTRLAVSLVSSASNKKLDPENDYLTVNERPAWALLERLLQADHGHTSSRRALETFRKAAER